MHTSYHYLFCWNAFENVFLFFFALSTKTEWLCESETFIFATISACTNVVFIFNTRTMCLSVLPALLKSATVLIIIIIINDSEAIITHFGSIFETQSRRFGLAAGADMSKHLDCVSKIDPKCVQIASL